MVRGRTGDRLDGGLVSRLAGTGLRCWLAAGLELVQGYQACKEGREDAAGAFTYALAGACAT